MIHIEYLNQTVQNLLEDYKKLFSVLKDKKKALQVMNRMRQIQACETMWDMAYIPGARIHPLDYEMSGYIAVDAPDKVTGYRIIMKPLNGEDVFKDRSYTLPPNPKLKTVTRIQICGWDDYHDK